MVSAKSWGNGPAKARGCPVDPLDCEDAVLICSRQDARFDAVMERVISDELRPSPPAFDHFHEVRPTLPAGGSETAMRLAATGTFNFSGGDVGFWILAHRHAGASSHNGTVRPEAHRALACGSRSRS